MHLMRYIAGLALLAVLGLLLYGHKNDQIPMQGHNTPSQVERFVNARDQTVVQTVAGASAKSVLNYRAYEATEYRWPSSTSADAIPGLLQAENPSERYTAYFDAEGIHILPQHVEVADWHFELKTAEIGYGEKRQPVAEARLFNEGNFVEYRRDFIYESFVNREDGIRHGFSIQSRPAGYEAGLPVTIRMHVSGDLRAQTAYENTAVALVDNQTQAQLHYSIEKAFDANGQDLRSQVMADNDGIFLTVDDSHAAYPITVIPVLSRNTSPFSIFVNGTYINGDGSFTAIFGYVNRIGEDFNVPNGPDNKLTGTVFPPLAFNERSTPIEDFPDTQGNSKADAFRVRFNGSNLVWTLKFQDVGKTTTANGSALQLNPTVRPVLECVTELPGGKLSASFGYLNELGFPMQIDIGGSNKFTPAPIDRGQPTVFNPGRIVGAFEVEFDPAVTTNLVWTLGPRTSTASNGTKRCTPPPSINDIRTKLDCVVNNGDGTYTAFWGYINNASVAIDVPVGSNNRFNRGGPDLGQPGLFLPGNHSRSFSTLFDGQNLVWTFNGRTSTASANPAQNCGNLASGLQLHYTFDDTTPNNQVADSSGNNRTGLMLPAAFTKATAQVDGVVGKALQFSGNRRIREQTAFDIIGAITLSAWVNASATDGLRYIIAHGRAAGAQQFAEVFLRINAGQYEVGTLNNAGVSNIATALIDPLDLNTWIHLAGTYDPNTSSWTLYRNGVVVATTTDDGTGALSVPNRFWHVGARSNPSLGNFAGTLDSIRVYNRALSQTEVRAMVPDRSIVEQVAPRVYTSAESEKLATPAPATTRATAPDSDF